MFYDEKGSSRICFQKMKKQVRSDNDASEVEISGYFGIFRDILGHGTFWDNLKNFMTRLEHLDHFPSHFRPFSHIIGSLKKNALPTDEPTDSGTFYTYAHLQAFS